MSEMYQKYLDPVIEEFTTGEHYREVYQAKQEYFEKAGVVYEDDPEFEQRMSIFMDWYLFDRDLPGVDLPPIKFYFRKHKERFNEEDLAIYRDFCATRHSLFRLKRHKWFNKGMVVQDLFSGKKMVVAETPVSTAFSRGDIFEARVIPFRGRLEFSRGFCFHPLEMESFILSEVKKVKYQDRGRQTKLILQLAAMKLKHMRFHHIDIQHVYTFDSKL